MWVQNPQGEAATVLEVFPPHWQCTVMRSLQMGSVGKGVMGVHSAGKVWSTITLLFLSYGQTECHKVTPIEVGPYKKEANLPNIANSGILLTILTKSFTWGSSLTTNIVGKSNKGHKFCHLVPVTALLQQQIKLLCINRAVQVAQLSQRECTTP